MFRLFLMAALMCCGLAFSSAGLAKKRPAWPNHQAEVYSGPMIKAYKRDPLPIYDDEGEKIRSATRAELPAIGSPGARVVRAKPGFVGIMLDGELAWLRLSTVDYVGDVNAIKCDAMAMKFAKMEEDGLDQSLGLGCAK
jgi:hypothetical protein